MTKLRVIILGIIFIAASLTTAHMVLHADEGAPVETLVIQTQSGTKYSFKVEIADTPEKNEQGLMFRTAMPADHGMLFELGAEGNVAFWMKNTLIPLDIIFVGRKGNIVRIAENATPESLAPIPAGAPVTGVIEFNGGIAAKMGLKPGDKVIHPFFQ
jgi:hypothetical protein